MTINKILALIALLYSLLQLYSTHINYIEDDPYPYVIFIYSLVSIMSIAYLLKATSPTAIITPIQPLQLTSTQPSRKIRHIKNNFKSRKIKNNTKRN